MEVKEIKIELKSLEETLNEFRDVWTDLEKGKNVKKKEAIYFTDIQALRAILTPKRIELLKTIKKYKPQSIYELAKLVNRNFKNVNEDLKLLNSLGLIKLIKSNKARKNSIPVVDYSSIDFKLAI
ncbi:HVO_A0114 family putative DNA-binding protein [Desulfothermus sp.]